MNNRLPVAATLAMMTSIIILWGGKAHGLPVFARLYKVECRTCHIIFPERNPFGDAFRKNSYVWPGTAPGSATAALDDDKDQDKGNGKGKDNAKDKGKDEEKGFQWLVAIPELVPVSFWVQHDVIYNDKKKPHFDLDGMTEFELFTAGAFRDKAGWWAEYNFAPDNELGEAYIQFRKPFKLPLNVKVGRFQPKLSLWKSNDFATISQYGYNEMVVGRTATTPGNPFEMDREQGGVEINSVIGHRVFAAAGVLTPPEKDRNSPDGYGHVSVRIGGIDFLGQPYSSNLDRESIWDFLTLTVGAFGYVGSSIAGTNDFYRTGLEMDALYKQFRLRLNSILGNDNNPQGTGVSETSYFGMAQAQYVFRENILAAMRYEYQRIEHEGITRRYIPSVTVAPWQNVRLALEYVHEVQPELTNRETTFRISFAF